MTLILFHAVQVHRGQLGGLFCLELNAQASWSVLKTEERNQTVASAECESNSMSTETGNLCIFLDERCLFFLKGKNTPDDSWYGSGTLEPRRRVSHRDGGKARHRVRRMQLKRTSERKDAAVSTGHYKASLTGVREMKSVLQLPRHPTETPRGSSEREKEENAGFLVFFPLKKKHINVQEPTAIPIWYGKKKHFTVTSNEPLHLC